MLSLSCIPHRMRTIEAASLSHRLTEDFEGEMVKQAICCTKNSVLNLDHPIIDCSSQWD